MKTLSDEDRNRVNLKPVPSTVVALDALPRPALLPDNRRAAPVELTTYTVRAVLLEIRDEADHDLHLVIADPADRSKTMIAEIVDPGCSGAIVSSDLADLRRARESFSQMDTAQLGWRRLWNQARDHRMRLVPDEDVHPVLVGHPGATFSFMSGISSTFTLSNSQSATFNFT